MRALTKASMGAVIAVTLASAPLLYAHDESANTQGGMQREADTMMQGGQSKIAMMNMMSQMSQMMESCNKMMQGMSMHQRGSKQAPAQQKE